MKTIFVALLISLFTSPFLAASQDAAASEAAVTVKGMVCSFCARGVEKIFGERAEVENVSVDLANQLVVLSFQEGRDLTNIEITALIEDAGYEVESIERAIKETLKD